ncbi:MAG: hypothetical protein JXA57_10295 [Armatimonadetes bacterium]|nr:hypothetical protein [Armatimonadota bacterium]
MPASTPGIRFDSAGVCSVCAAYAPSEPLGEDALLRELASISTSDLPHDCVVPISGGLDSFYTAHRLIRRLKLRCLGVHYDHGFGSDSKEQMLRWVEDTLEMPIIRVAWPQEKTAWLIAESMRALLPFGPKYMQAAVCRQCGYGIRAAVYSEMARQGIHSVWGMHTMDTVPFRYCLDVGLLRYLTQPAARHAVQALRARWRQMSDITAPGVSPGQLLWRGFGYPELPRGLSHLKVLRLFDFVPWDKERMIAELREQGVDTEAFLRAHSDCTLAPLVEHILRTAWGVGKAEIYVCNRVRARQLDRQEGLSMIISLRDERPRIEILEQLGLREVEIKRLFQHAG